MCEHIARIGQTENSFKISVAKPERKRSLGRHGRRWNKT